MDIMIQGMLSVLLVVTLVKNVNFHLDNVLIVMSCIIEHMTLVIKPVIVCLDTLMKDFRLVRNVYIVVKHVPCITNVIHAMILI